MKKLTPAVAYYRMSDDKLQKKEAPEFDLVAIASGDLTDEALSAWIDLCIEIEERMLHQNNETQE